MEISYHIPHTNTFLNNYSQVWWIHIGTFNTSMFDEVAVIELEYLHVRNFYLSPGVVDQSTYSFSTKR